MSKLKLEYGEDYRGIQCLIAKKRGKINEREVYERLEHDYPGQMFIHIFQVFDETPVSYYDEEDVWCLYEPYDIIPSIIKYIGGIDCLPQSVVDGYRRVLCKGGD